MKMQSIEIPVHPEEFDVPISEIYIFLSKGRYARIKGPLGRKTLEALQGTLLANKDSMIYPKDGGEDFSI